MSTLETKRETLRAELATSDRLLVAYSGGVDSAYLAWEAYQVLGDRMLAVIADSPSLPRKHLSAAIDFAQQNHIPLRVINTREMEKPDYTRNDSQRCFHCKDELFLAMETLSEELGVSTIAYGRNLDDNGDFRPGQKAAAQHNAIAPLATAQLGKQEIRTLAKNANLTVWDKPASACLSSRLEYGREVTPEALAQVEAAEDALNALGFLQVRVRHHGTLARIEIAREELHRALSMDALDKITAAVRAAGFQYVTLDTQGYRSGSMNAILPVSILTAS
ncbi:ATP-dependent sacrificial sulfur transferase LarE [Terriglobus tenax]|uniref:ATP-dependent sacrificial sulfur transferase LarE n=1 Tax=Terriglobus tenax TaxID=1111115 RepID=UPI0021DFD35D|nr:ATP-dependent sacrificial sulfur transferase LarE [Terriglobus tenax]